MGQLGTACVTLERLGTPWDDLEHLGTTRNTLGRPGTPWVHSEHAATAWNSLGRLGTWLQNKIDVAYQLTTSSSHCTQNNLNLTLTPHHTPHTNHQPNTTIKKQAANKQTTNQQQLTILLQASPTGLASETWRALHSDLSLNTGRTSEKR